MWDEIHGFATLGEYERFLDFLGEQEEIGRVVEIPVDPDYGRGEIYGGRWFRYVETGEVWRLISPDPPFRGLWELVDLLPDSRRPK